MRHFGLHEWTTSKCHKTLSKWVIIWALDLALLPLWRKERIEKRKGGEKRKERKERREKRGERKERREKREEGGRKKEEEEREEGRKESQPGAGQCWCATGQKTPASILALAGWLALGGRRWPASIVQLAVGALAGQRWPASARGLPPFGQRWLASAGCQRQTSAPAS